ncbi:MAG: HAD hydrolase-like protein [Gammaproteobacteria bacterium]
MLSRYTCWVFDLDGTLTVHQHDFDAIRAALGIPAGRLILEYLASLPPAAAAPLHARLAALEAELCAGAEAAPGAHALLAELAARGHRRGILTRSTRDNALATLAAAGLAGFFAPADVLGRDDAAPKPAADGIVRLLARWGGAPGRSVMVGDFRLDLEAGRNAGVATAHVTSDASQHWPALTDYRFATLAALLCALRGQERT